MSEQLVRVPPAAVIAAIDGSDIALAAAGVAAAEAEQRHRPLVLMHCFMWPALYPPMTAPFPPEPGPRKRAESLLATAADAIRSAHPAVNTQVLLRNGPPAAMLTEESGRASLLVLGHRGSGGFAGLHIGSVAIHTAAHARCPVFVVRGDPPAPDAADHRRGRRIRRSQARTGLRVPDRRAAPRPPPGRGCVAVDLDTALAPSRSPPCTRPSSASPTNSETCRRATRRSNTSPRRTGRLGRRRADRRGPRCRPRGRRLTRAGRAARHPARLGRTGADRALSLSRRGLPDRIGANWPCRRRPC